MACPSTKVIVSSRRSEGVLVFDIYKLFAMDILKLSSTLKGSE
jgi:hypothetical protein